MKFYRAELPHYVCGFFVDSKTNTIKECAPIMNWAKNKNIKYFENWVKNKKGKIQLLSEE